MGRPRRGSATSSAGSSGPGRARSSSRTPPRSTCSRCSSRRRGCAPGAAWCSPTAGPSPPTSTSSPRSPRMLDLEVVDVTSGEALAAVAEHADRLAFAAFGQVDYRTGELWDVDAITRGRPRRRRADVLGPVPLGRRPARGPRRPRGRPRRRLRLQVPQRRAGRAGVRLRRLAPPGGVRPAADRLAGARHAVRDEPALPGRRGHLPRPGGHRPPALAAGARGRAHGVRRAVRGGRAGPVALAHPVLPGVPRRPRRRPRGGDAAGGRAARVAGLAAPPARPTPSCRR